MELRPKRVSRAQLVQPLTSEIWPLQYLPSHTSYCRTINCFSFLPTPWGPQLSFYCSSFLIWNKPRPQHPPSSPSCLTSCSSVQTQLRSQAPSRTQAGIRVRRLCFHSTLCWNLSLYLAHFNETICLPIHLPHRDISTLLCMWSKEQSP